jgi:hypothetical protein
MDPTVNLPGILLGFQSHIFQFKNQDDDDTAKDHRSKAYEKKAAKILQERINKEQPFMQ